MVVGRLYLEPNILRMNEADARAGQIMKQTPADWRGGQRSIKGTAPGSVIDQVHHMTFIPAARPHTWAKIQRTTLLQRLGPAR